MKMRHDDFEAWIRERSRGCVAESEIDGFCMGELDFTSGEYTFHDLSVQSQWEAWQAGRKDGMGMRYEIKTVNDFLSIPLDRLEDCLKEFQTSLEIAHATAEMVSAGSEGAFGAVMPMWNWIDDGKINQDVQFDGLKVELRDGNAQEASG